jgi:uncharacterized OB-fold protein
MTRPAPNYTPRTAEYWNCGRDGILKVATCQGCGWRTHPPSSVCPRCRGVNVAFAPVSGRGRVYAWTINRYRWAPELEPPYIVAQVELEEQAGLIIMAAVVDCPFDQIRTDLPVQVAFEPAGEVWAPVFRP